MIIKYEIYSFNYYIPIYLGLKGKKGKSDRETIKILNILNMTTKGQLVPVEGDAIKKIQQAQKIKYR
jgi:hypothetical protein